MAIARTGTYIIEETGVNTVIVNVVKDDIQKVIETDSDGNVYLFTDVEDNILLGMTLSAIEVIRPRARITKSRRRFFKSDSETSDNADAN